MTDAPASPPPERSSYVPRHVRMALEQERTWPGRVGRVWGAILFLHFFWPVFYLPSMGFGSSQWIFAWDALENAEWVGVLFVFTPLLVGLVAYLAGRSATRRTQGLLYLCGGMLMILITVAGEDTREKLMESAIRGESGVFIALLFLLGPILLAGGNHVQRREAGRSLPTVLAGLGGAALTVVWFIPVSGETLIGGLFSGPVLKEAWPLSLWALLVIVTGLLGACLLVPGIDTAAVGGRVSRGIRLSLNLFPVALLITLVMAGGFFMSGVVLIVWVVSRLYGFLILTAAGLAIVMRGPMPELEERDWARDF
ncbi:MAG: hypothetical protein QNJ98_18630 [Planctomycetota bacterium]|nr:hypothetical protein [Planctomycetota bacterium]